MNNSKFFACLLLSLSTLVGLTEVNASTTIESTIAQESVSPLTLSNPLAVMNQQNVTKPKKRKKSIKSKKKNQWCYFGQKQNKFKKRSARKNKNNISNCYSYRKGSKKIF